MCNAPEVAASAESARVATKQKAARLKARVCDVLMVKLAGWNLFAIIIEYEFHLQASADTPLCRSDSQRSSCFSLIKYCNRSAPSDCKQGAHTTTSRNTDTYKQGAHGQTVPEAGVGCLGVRDARIGLQLLEDLSVRLFALQHQGSFGKVEGKGICCAGISGYRRWRGKKHRGNTAVAANRRNLPDAGYNAASVAKGPQTAACFEAYAAL